MPPPFWVGIGVTPMVWGAWAQYGALMNFVQLPV